MSKYFLGILCQECVYDIDSFFLLFALGYMDLYVIT